MPRSAGTEHGRRGQRPNVVVFFSDQQRWDTTGLHGNPMGLTPNFDRLAHAHTHVAHSFTCQPVCGPARSCMQTGQYATSTGCYRNGIPLPAQSRTLAHYFAEAGYQTGYIGKWHLHDSSVHGPVPADRRFGYDHWLASNVLEFTSHEYDTVLYDSEDNEVKLPGYRVDALADAAIRYIDAKKEDPFFLFLSFIEPHHQNDVDDYPPPEGYRERFTGGWMPPDLAALGGSAHRHLGGYYGQVKRLDEALGRVWDALVSLGLEEDTVLLQTSDHGCHFRTRNSEYKRSCHESSIRVPTMLAGHGFRGGGMVHELVSLIDLPPTLLDAAGLQVPEQMAGRSILPLLRGDGDGWPEEVLIQVSESQTGRAVRTRRWKYGVDAPAVDGRREMASLRYVEQFLYDLQSDPYELENLVAAGPNDVKEQLRVRLQQRMVEAAEDEPVIESYTGSR